MTDEVQVFGDWTFDCGSLIVTCTPREGSRVNHIRQRFLEIWMRETNTRWRIGRIMDKPTQVDS